MTREVDKKLQSLLRTGQIGGAIDTGQLLSIWSGASSDTRYDALEIIFEKNLADKETLERLLRIEVLDTEELNRANAIELAGAYADHQIFGDIASFFDDDSELVRCAAIDLVGDFRLRNYAEMLNEKLTKETDRVQVSCLASLIQVPDQNEKRENYLHQLFLLIDSEDYHARCAVANAFPEILTPAEIGKARMCLSKRLKTETTVAVLSTIERVLDELDSKK